MTRFLLPTLLAGAALAPTAFAQKLSADRQQGELSVDAEQCSKWLHTLAGPEFAGRGTGQEGYRKAADYVAAHFKALGLEARGENGSYFQNMPWNQSKVTKAELTFTQGDQTVLTIPADRLGGNASKSTNANGEVALLNIEVPPIKNRRMPTIEGLDDLEVEGKVVVAVVRADFLAWDPGPRRFDVALTNPPFSLARPFVEHARGMADHVVMLLRLNFLASAGRAPWMRQDAPDVYVLPNRPSFTGKGTDSIDYAWFHWGPQVRSQGALRVLRPLPASERRPKQ